MNVDLDDPQSVDEAFRDQIVTDSARVMFCHPDSVERIQALVDREGWSLVEVRPSVFIESPSRVIVFDENAFTAIGNQRETIRGSG